MIPTPDAEPLEAFPADVLDAMTERDALVALLVEIRALRLDLAAIPERMVGGMGAMGGILRSLTGNGR